jgi:regulator of RNase E activity RraA
MTPELSPELLRLLQSVDTPTVCNAIETAQGRRGFQGYTRGTMLCSAPADPPIVGFAVTAKIAALVPSSEPSDVIRARRMAYYRAMAAGPQPAIAVVEDTDFPACVGAYWGEVNTAVHKGFGMAGALTNGVMRDLGDMAANFPVIAGSIGPSHAFVRVTEIGTPVTIFGLAVAPGDLIHADRHGAVCIPTEVISRLPDAISKMRRTEAIILDAARAPGFDFAAFTAAWAAFERERT